MQPLNEPRSDQSDTRRPIKAHQELLNFLGLSNFRQLFLILVLEIVVVWMALTVAASLVLYGFPPKTVPWQHFQTLVSTRRDVVGFLFALAVGVVVPTFIWFQVLFLWIGVLLKRRPIKSLRPPQTSEKSR